MKGKSIKAIVSDLRVSRKVVRKVLRSGATEFTYEREEQPHPKLGPFIGRFEELPTQNAVRRRRERLARVGCGVPTAPQKGPAGAGSTTT